MSAQTRSLPSHGKIKLDSYNYLLRDVHPASQAQANYLQNRLFLAGLKKAERLERHERVDSYGEKQFIKTLKDYDSAVRRLGAGSTSAVDLKKFWVLVSACGDRAELYDALSAEVPPMSDTEFTPSAKYIQILRANGELAPLPLLLESAEGLDASKLYLAWHSLVEDLRTTTGPAAHKVDGFCAIVNAFCQQGMDAIEAQKRNIGRYDAKNYLRSLGSLADALSRSQQFAQVQTFVQQGGYGFEGGSALAMLNHMLRNRLEAAQGRSAQLALAEIARPMSRLLEQEIALHYERIDSLASREGHRPYAPEYRRDENQSFGTSPNENVTPATPAGHAGI